MWITTLKSQTLSKVRVSDWSVQHVIPLPYGRAHGVVRVEDGVWVVHTADRVIVKLDCVGVGNSIGLRCRQAIQSRTACRHLKIIFYTAMQRLVGSCKSTFEVHSDEADYDVELEPPSDAR